MHYVKALWGYTAGAMIGAIGGGLLVKRLWMEKYRVQTEQLKNTNQERDLLRDWLQLSCKGEPCKEYFLKRGFQRVGIFGMNWEGRLLAELLGDLAVYGVELDNYNSVHERFLVYRLGDDTLPQADCIVICDLTQISEKQSRIRKEFSGEVLTLQEFLSDIG